MVIKCPRNIRDVVNTVFEDFETATGYQTEEVEYSAVYSRDVNSYIAIGTTGKVKTKGTFSHSGLQKNPENDICALALIAYLKDGIPIEQTVRECKDLTKFVTVRTVKGGGIYGDKYLGKVVRWYHGLGATGCITYRTSGNKVPNSDGATPCMDLPIDFPEDIDYDWYVKNTEELLMDIGLVTRPPKVRKARSKKL
jgi:hypothetical protein